MNYAKYLILRDVAGSKHVAMFDGAIEHRAMVPAGMTPLSAGFVMISGDQIIIPAIGSDTLGLEPRPGDKQRLAAFLNSRPANAHPLLGEREGVRADQTNSNPEMVESSAR